MHSAPRYTEVERAIRSVPGVAEASVVEASDTGRGRLRIRLQPGEDAERVAWSVSATLRERFGIALDPDEIRPRIDVANGASEPPGRGGDDVAPAGGGPALPTTPTLDHEPPPPPAPEVTSEEVVGDEVRTTTDRVRSARPPRAVIRDLRSRTRPEGVEVTATLDLGGRMAQGQSSGVSTTRGLLRTIAEATVMALGELTGERLRAQVDRVTLGEADPATVTVVVTLLSERGEELLLGASIVRDDVEHAVMRATLDALNRRVERDLSA